ncbi:MAG TPA: hypothetical protein VNO70_17845 [Blastocatellia bacterium]|nr:hypothetical protein [Blastocatellia bacterium]
MQKRRAIMPVRRERDERVLTRSVCASSAQATGRPDGAAAGGEWEMAAPALAQVPATAWRPRQSLPG